VEVAEAASRPVERSVGWKQSVRRTTRVRQARPGDLPGHKLREFEHVVAGTRQISLPRAAGVAKTFGLHDVVFVLIHFSIVGRMARPTPQWMSWRCPGPDVNLEVERIPLDSERNGSSSDRSTPRFVLALVAGGVMSSPAGRKAEAPLRCRCFQSEPVIAALPPHSV